VIVIYAGTKGYLDKIDVKDVTKYEMGLLKHLRTNCKDLLDDLTKNDRKVDGDLEDKIKAELEKFTTSFA
jgi:F-type H+-transporting ATPase subunit alpha